MTYTYIDKDKQGDDCFACPTCDYNTSNTPAYHDQPPHECARAEEPIIPGFNGSK